MSLIKHIVSRVLSEEYTYLLADWKNKALNNVHYKRELEAINRRTEFYAAFISSDSLVFDVGANLGNRISSFLNIGAKVIAVEPQIFCCRYLRKKFGTRITIENMAAGSQPGHLDLFVSDSHTLTSLSKDYVDKVGKTRFSEAKWKKSKLVEVTTLSHLIQRHGLPDFIKIDLEGFELEVLKGLDQEVQCISFEYNTPDMKEIMFDCLNTLHKISPRYEFNFSEGESMLLSKKSWLEFDAFMQLVQKDEFLNTGFGDVYCRLRQ
jgi:FkbM family methyltransferase